MGAVPAPARRRQRLAAAGLLTASLSWVQCGGGAPLASIDEQALVPCSRAGGANGDAVLATASPGGAYAALGDAIAQVNATGTGRKITVCTSEGSGENLSLLRDHKVQYALAQLDTLHYAIEAAGDGPAPLGDVRLVTYLYSEKLHLFVKPHLYLNSPADLNQSGSSADENSFSRRGRVWLGPNGSGGRQTALKVLQAAGVPDEDARTFGPISRDEGLSWSVAANCLLSDAPGSLVAYFRTMPVPRSAPEGVHDVRGLGCPLVDSEAAPADLSVDDLLRADAQIMPLPPALIERLTEDGLYVRATIDLGNYPHLKRGIPTVGIPTVLLTNLPEGEPGAVEALLDQIEDRKEAIERHIGGVELDLLSRVEDVERLAKHPGAAKHFRRRLSNAVWLGLFAFGLLAASWWRDPNTVRRGLAAGSFVWVISASLTAIWVLLSLLMMRAEGRLNPKFATIGESFGSTFGVVTRFRDYPLMTSEGEIWRWLGLLVFPVVLGWLLSDVLKNVLNIAAAKLKRFIASARARDAHVVIVATASRLKRAAEWIAGRPLQAPGAFVFLNWNHRAEEMVRAIRRDALNAGRPIVVVRPDGCAANPLDVSAVDGVSVVHGDPTARATMEKAGILDARAVTIVSAWTPPDPRDRRRTIDPEYADSKTIMTILAIRAFCEDGRRSAALPVSAEIRLTRSEREARGVVQGGPLSLTCLAV